MGMDTPVVSKVSYDGAQVKVWWQSVSAESVTGYKILVASSNNGTVHQSALISGRVANFGVLSLTAPLDTNIVYTLQVQSQTASGPDIASLQVPMLTRLPVLTRAVYDGADLDFIFEPVPESASGGYTLRVYSQNTGSTYTSSIANPNATSGSIAASALPSAGLDPAQQWTVTVCAEGENGCEACVADINLPMPLPTLSVGQGSYQANEQLLVNWQAVTGVESYVVSVSSEAENSNYEISVADRAATSATLSFPRALYTAQNYTLQLIGLNSVGAGVATAKQHVIVSVPKITSAQYGGSSVRLTWQPSIDIGVSGYTLRVMSLSTGQTFSLNVPGANASSGQVDTSLLDIEQAWVATVSATADEMIDGQSRQYPLMVSQVTIDRVTYDGSQLLVEWTQPEDEAITAYRISLRDGSSILQSIEVIRNNSVVMPLSAALSDSTYTVQIDAVSSCGALASRVSASLLTQLPTVKYAVYEGNKVVVSWASYSGVSRFDAAIFSEIAQARYVSSEDSGAAVSTTISLPGALGTDAGYQFQLSASTADGIVVSTAPTALSTELVPLNSLVYDGTEITGQWEPVSDSTSTITGYLLKVVAQGSGTTFYAESQNPLANTLTINNLGAGLSAEDTYQGFLVVQNENNTSTWGIPKTLPAAVPALSYANYDGKQILAGWQPVSVKEGTVSGYLMLVTSLQDTSKYQTLIPNVAATAGVLPLPMGLNVNQGYRFALSAISADGAMGTSIFQNIITTRPDIISINIDSATIKVVWSLTQNVAVTGFTLVLLSLNSGTTYRSSVEGGTASSGSIPIPAGGLDAAQNWVVQIWTETTGDNVVGAISDPVPLVVERAVISTAKYDGVSVVAQWIPANNEAVSAYRMTVTAASSGAEYHCQVTGEFADTATLQLASPLPTGDTYSLTVTAIVNSMELMVNGANVTVTTSSDTLALDIELPKTNSVIYGDGSVSATWTEVTNTDVSGYTLVVASTQTGKIFAADVDGRDTTHGSVSVDGLLATDENYCFSLRTINPDAASACSTSAAIITRLPTLVNVSYDAAEIISANWVAQADTFANLTSFMLAVRAPHNTVPVSSHTFASPAIREGSFNAGSVVTGNLLDIRAVAESGVISVGNAVTIVDSQPEITGVVYKSGVLIVTWDAAANTHYLLTIKDADGSSIASAKSIGGQAIVDVGLATSLSYSAVLQVVVTTGGLISLGPASDAVSIIVGTVSMTSIVYDGAAVTVNFSPPHDANAVTNYNAFLYSNGTSPVSATVSGTQAIFNGVLDDINRYTVVVQATGSKTIGPTSAVQEVVTATPLILSASLDGSNLIVEWQSMKSLDVSGYQIQLLQGTTVVTNFETVHSSLHESVTLTAGENYTVKVRGLAGLAKGPYSSDFEVDSNGFQYYIEGAQDTVQPYLFRTLRHSPASPAESISLYLPEIFNSTQSNPVNPAGPFTLTPTNSTPYAYVLNFTDDSAVWTFDNNAIRSALRIGYNAFLQALEAVEGGMTEFGLDLIREVIALGIPLTFDESLFYRYGFEPNDGFCDLQPGMALRLDSEVYQFVGTSGSASQVSGFVSNGSSIHQIGAYMASNGMRETGINAFLSASGRPNVSPNSRGSGGIVDLYATSFRRRYYRMFYPQSFVSSDSEGQVGINSNVAVLGCNSWTVLNEATTSYLATGNFDSVTGDISYTFFRGRMVGTPMLTVLLNNVPQQLPIGTTVRELVQRYAQMPMAEGTSVSNLSLDRLTGNVVNAAQTVVTLDVSARDPVRLTVNPYTIVLQHKDAYDLPLLNGDQLTIA